MLLSSLETLDPSTRQQHAKTTAAACPALLPSVDHSRCVEKAELVDLLARSRNNAATRTQQQQPLNADPALQQPEACDISPWLHWALFHRAEAGETAEGRTAAVQGMYRAAVAALQCCLGGDELYGLLISSNCLRSLVDGGTPFTVRRVAAGMPQEAASFTCDTRCTNKVIQCAEALLYSARTRQDVSILCCSCVALTAEDLATKRQPLVATLSTSQVPSAQLLRRQTGQQLLVSAAAAYACCL
jgi:hypothetical protein